MSREGRGIVVSILKNFWDSLKPRQFRGTLVGEDHYGTKYYEITGEGRQRKERYFVPLTKEEFDQEIPSEWESWLRGRRVTPPTKEEILKNYQLMVSKKENATELDLKHKGAAKIEQEKQATGFHSFPVYEEYKDDPLNKK
ncbi:NADH dehydrogenase [ubiquinone] 1 alpha subcomplex assembly factor 2-like [Nilaparvata lugens]|uniref:NADH dehydrogenase [ubiquinone] 1 alpha subcomplex assembly factor 2 n=1 Tax=Nilaparvata lugens TaxID=108931 RepID=UPI000B988B7A|nr:NADH dehydrogenase [ubiquinone] 1 alpha subcomplex assembly factor 2 [Nilaparvata lugens]XP_039282154.1 NADH dehydrogenase [ubiquinone] 1 alpha subcomplex assembly factor 2-like [Nilaparvata lugens]XP_039282155.1 NADH dehydrogenase [ubiquinone] 1 alpha subcomplex assembly factor 2-like [Nilaparvata lugens]XP_039282156.1 NADH dehydrogenase [ubiquinone] 1 alpha subcomplex assembly factor 2-like [Nilaparvata lugens]